MTKLNDVVNIATADGNWNANPYMHGMANGLLLAEAIVEDKEVKYLDAPEKWLSE